MVGLTSFKELKFTLLCCYITKEIGNPAGKKIEGF